MFFKKLSRYVALRTGDFAKIFKDFKIPTLPQVVTKILELMQQPEVNLVEIAKLIECDPGLTSQLLKMVNSAFCGLSREIVNVQHAISVLGIKGVENLVVSYGVFKIVKSPKMQGFQLDIFWTDSLMRALFARELARLKKIPSDEIFLGALLQDIALPILLTEWFDVYQRAYKKWQGSGKRLSDIEKKELSWDHAQAGAWIAKNWKLPEILILSIALHVSSAEELIKLRLQDTPIALASLSSEIPSVLKERHDFSPLLEKAKALGIKPQSLIKAAEKSEDIFLDTASGLGLSVKTPSSLKHILESHFKSS